MTNRENMPAWETHKSSLACSFKLFVIRTDKSGYYFDKNSKRTVHVFRGATEWWKFNKTRSLQAMKIWKRLLKPQLRFEGKIMLKLWLTLLGLVEFAQPFMFKHILNHIRFSLSPNTTVLGIVLLWENCMWRKWTNYCKTLHGNWFCNL